MTETQKKKLTGKKVNMHAYVMPETYEEMKRFANPDDGDRWEAPLLRRIIREWLEAQKKSALSPTSMQYGTKETGSAAVKGLSVAEKKVRYKGA